MPAGKDGESEMSAMGELQIPLPALVLMLVLVFGIGYLLSRMRIRW